MWPTLILPPGSAAETTLIVVTTAVAFASAVSARWRRELDLHLTLVFVAYLAGTVAVALGIHASLGQSPLALSSYGIAIAIGAMVAWAILLRRLTGIGLGLPTIFTIIAGCLGLGLAGARAAELLTAAWTSQPVLESDGGLAGLSVFGAFAVNATFLWLLLGRKPGRWFGRTLDAGASAVFVNLGIGRIGCVLAGCCYGGPSAAPAPFSIATAAFAPDTPAAMESSSPRIWATQPAEAIGALAIAGLAEVLFRSHARARLAPGAIVVICAGSYGLLRFVLEFFRADTPRSVGGITTPWQIAAAALMVGAAIWLLRSGKLKPANED
jgi:phosphatidylglycerol:prolipoprotein diacylglycerol transferase